MNAPFAGFALALSVVAPAAFAAGLVPVSAEALMLWERRGSAPVVLDVRTAEEYAEGHVPGAWLVPHDTVQAHLPTLLPLLGREVVVYCQSGRRAAKAEEALRALGMTNVRQMDGHWQQWESARLPVATGTAPGHYR